jgi:hypothetical protein
VRAGTPMMEQAEAAAVLTFLAAIVLLAILVW